jgi:hypothetical protein
MVMVNVLPGVSSRAVIAMFMLVVLMVRTLPMAGMLRPRLCGRGRAKLPMSVFSVHREHP